MTAAQENRQDKPQVEKQVRLGMSSVLEPGYWSSSAGRKTMVVWAVMIIGILLYGIFVYGSPHTPHERAESSNTEINRVRRSPPEEVPLRQVAITQDKGETILWYNSSSVHVATFTFDFCHIASCPSTAWQCNVYRNTPASRSIYICVTDDYWGQDCASWGAVGWNTGNEWGHRPQSAMDKKDRNGKSLISRMTLTAPEVCRSGGKTGSNMKLVLTLENPSPGDAGTYVLAAWLAGGSDGPKGKFHLKDMYNSKEWQSLQTPEDQPNPLMPPGTVNKMTAFANPTYEDTIAIETGYGETNVWLEWTRYTARQHNMTNCYVCASARPHIGTVPLNVPSEIEECILSVFTNTTMSNDSSCEDWKQAYPLTTKPRKPRMLISVYKGNYTCYNGSSEGVTVKTFSPGYCASYSTTDSKKLENQTTAMSDVYWLCGDLAIRQILPQKWKGQCALAKLIMPIHMIGEKEGQERPSAQPSRKRRDARGPGGSLDPHVYIDAIGVPRGVPDEFKARDQVATGFESLLPQVTINKNVDWINYIYYNQQRFVNYTRDALAGLAAELGPNSRMTFQNRMALDMILAERGGVCKMIGVSDTCCTFIPNNTGPTGKVTRALQKLTDLSEELKRNSGIDKPWGSWFEGMFSTWQAALKIIGIMVVCVILVLSAVACCVVPLVKRMFNKTMVRDDEYIDVETCDETENPPLKFD